MSKVKNLVNRYSLYLIGLFITSLDVFYIFVSVIISLACTGQVQGVREGSVIAALSIGLIIKWYHHLENFLKRYRGIA